MLIYATEHDLGAYTTEIPDNVEVFLRAASLLVRDATKADLYDVDPAGAPTDPWVIDAMKAAVCWTVTEWIVAGLDPAAGMAGQEQAPVSTSIAGASVTYDTAAQAAREQVSLTRLGVNALTELRSAGLASRRVWS